MSLPTPCPEPARWRRLLDGTLPEEVVHDLNGHLEGCRHCQLTLEGLAASKEWWSGTARELSRGEREADPALRQAVRELKQEAGRTQTPTGQAPDEDGEALTFLSPSDEPGSLGRLGRYEVLERIGRGGMGVVLKAFDPSLHRVVAVKVLAPQLAASATARRRFTREAQAAAAVRDDRVIDIYAVEEANGLPYLVMEYVAGPSLQERLDRAGPLKLEEILRIGMQTAAGLAAAHRQGLVHRDVKPANILLENGIERVKITDFGLARAVDDASVSHSGVVAGTPEYMAPEQARGEAVDHRADLFSLGSVLYAMCAGRPPFRAAGTLGVLRRVSEDTPRPVREVNPDVPDWLAAVIGKLHAKEPAGRFEGAASVAEILGKQLNRLQQPPPAPDSCGPDFQAVPVPAGKRCLRRWVVGAAAILVLLAGLGLAEAAGLTRLAVTVLRILTPEGILAVEIEDPETRVAIEGEGEEVVITGAGVHEVRLRPGDHRWRATRGDRLVGDELVTVRRGGKQVVTVRREAAPRQPAKDEDGWVSPFNGKDLAGWFVEGGDPGAWQVKGGELVVEGTSLPDKDRGIHGATGLRRFNWLLTEKTYCEFVLRFEYQLSRGANSGVALWATPGEKVYREGPIHLEVKLLDDPSYPTIGWPTGTLFWNLDGGGHLRRPDRRAKVQPVGSWNQVEVEARTQSLRVSVNGLEVLRARPDKLAEESGAFAGLKRCSGHLGYEKNTGVARFRNIEIKELKPATGPQENKQPLSSG